MLIHIIFSILCPNDTNLHQNLYCKRFDSPPITLHVCMSYMSIVHEYVFVTFNGCTDTHTFSEFQIRY